MIRAGAIMSLFLVVGCSFNTHGIQEGDARFVDAATDASGDLISEDQLPGDVATPDAPVKDAPMAEASLPDGGSPEAAPPEIGLPDTALPDLQQPDTLIVHDLLQPDASPPDQQQPDAPLPDQQQPDSVVPDQQQPVAPLPDLLQPDTAPPPDTLPPDTVLTGQWFQADNQVCPSFCKTKGKKNIKSPEGSHCMSGEVRPKSGMDQGIKFTYGCWTSCTPRTSYKISVSHGGYCYNNGQNKDQDNTDRTVGCFCI